MKKSKVVMGLAAGVMVSMIGSVLATPITVPVTKDSSYNLSWPQGWASAYVNLYVGFTHNDGMSYFYADLPAISLPPGQQVRIDSAALNFQVVQVMDSWGWPQAFTHTAYRIASDWSEGSSIGDNSWDYTTVPPTTEEAYGSRTTVAGGASDLMGWYQIDVTTLAQAWVDGTAPNYGVMVQQQGGAFLRCYSREAGGDNAPYFSVSYSLVPEPAMMSLLGLGVIGWLRGRR